MPHQSCWIFSLFDFFELCPSEVVADLCLLTESTETRIFFNISLFIKNMHEVQIARHDLMVRQDLTLTVSGCPQFLAPLFSVEISAT